MMINQIEIIKEKKLKLLFLKILYYYSIKMAQTLLDKLSDKKQTKKEDEIPKPKKTYYVKKIKIPKPPKILKKRGRKIEPKKYEINDMKPNEVLDFSIKNYPQMGIEKLKDKILTEMFETKNNNNDILIKFSHDDTYYYYDNNTNDVFNQNGTKIGTMITDSKGEKQLNKFFNN